MLSQSNDRSADALERLSQGASQVGLELSDDQLAQFARYEALLLDWNGRINLTAITDPAEIAAKHFLDSLTLAPLLNESFAGPAPRRLADVGSGAGFPGIPIAIVLPRFHVTLVEATGKKCRFLELVVRDLGLPNVEVRGGRAEDLAHDSSLRARFDVVVARAVASLPSLLELTLPFARIGGLVVAMKKASIDHEIADARFAASALGGSLTTSLTVNVPFVVEPRLLVVVAKIRPTPAEYPRRPGIPTKHPLGQKPR